MLSQAPENEEALVIGMKTGSGWVAEVKSININSRQNP